MTKSLISMVRSESTLYGELSIGGVLLNSLADRVLDGVTRLFLSNPCPNEAMLAAFEATRVRKKRKN